MKEGDHRIMESKTTRVVWRNSTLLPFLLASLLGVTYLLYISPAIVNSQREIDSATIVSSPGFQQPSSEQDRYGLGAPASQTAKRSLAIRTDTTRGIGNPGTQTIYQFAQNSQANGFGAAAREVGQQFLTQLSGQGMQWMPRSLRQYFTPGESPEWWQRVTIDLDLLQYDQPVYSIRTIQPLFQSESKMHTVFTQLRVARTYDFGEWRNVTNMGVGYRRLLLQNTVLLGANAHLDRGWDHDHTRTGLGLEARWFGFDWYLNGYWGVSGNHTYQVTGKEKVLDGWDSRLLLQIPYVPSMRVVGVVSQWDKTSGTVNDWRTGLEADITPFTQVQFGVTDSTDAKQGYYFQIRFNLGSYSNRPVLSDRPIRKEAWVMRDMSVHTLDRVRREENIVKERVTDGVTVRVGRSN
jgi:hypothetical protein